VEDQVRLEVVAVHEEVDMAVVVVEQEEVMIVVILLGVEDIVVVTEVVVVEVMLHTRGRCKPHADHGHWQGLCYLGSLLIIVLENSPGGTLDLAYTMCALS
jgi:type IV secretory pathway VirB3-like protein